MIYSFHAPGTKNNKQQQLKKPLHVQQQVLKSTLKKIYQSEECHYIFYARYLFIFPAWSCGRVSTGNLS